MIRLMWSLIFLICGGNISAQDLIKGITVVAPPYQIDEKPLKEVVKLGADWVAVVPYGYSQLGEPEVQYNLDWQWWGEHIKGARSTIEMAKSQGLKVMLKPHVYVPSAWPGAIDFKTEEAWQKWEASYTEYILAFAQVAADFEVELFSIGTEFSISTKKRHDFWHDLIYKIKNIYSGQLTYSANWDEYTHVPFWEELDYIGVDAYFPLLQATTPKVEELITAWVPHKILLKRISKINNKPILFTEYGYLSIDNCADKTWELEKIIDSSEINQKAQANAIAGLFESFKNEAFWAGGFYWKWFPNMTGHEGYPARDYTFQGKKGEEVIKGYFGVDY